MRMLRVLSRYDGLRIGNLPPIKGKNKNSYINFGKYIDRQGKKCYNKRRKNLYVYGLRNGDGGMEGIAGISVFIRLKE